MSAIIDEFRAGLKGLTTEELNQLSAQLTARAGCLVEEVNVIQESLLLQQALRQCRAGFGPIEGLSEYVN